MKPNAKLMLFRLKPWSSAAGGSLHITVQCMCKQTVTRVTANTDDAMRRPRDARGGGAAMWTRRAPVLHRTSSTMKRTISSNRAASPSGLLTGPGCRTMTFVHTCTGATAAAPPQQQAWPHDLRMQDAPWQAWSHACACRTLPGKLGHMPPQAGRSVRQAWSHATTCRTLPEAPRLVTCRCMQDAPWLRLASSDAKHAGRTLGRRRRLLLSHFRRAQLHPQRCSALLPLRPPRNSSLCSATCDHVHQCAICASMLKRAWSFLHKSVCTSGCART